MAHAVLLVLLLGCSSLQVWAEPALETVPAPSTVSLNAGSTLAFTQPHSTPAVWAKIAVVPGDFDPSVTVSTGRNLSRPWPEMRHTGRLAPPDIFVPPRGERGFGCAPRRG